MSSDSRACELAIGMGIVHERVDMAKRRMVDQISCAKNRHEMFFLVFIFWTCVGTENEYFLDMCLN